MGVASDFFLRSLAKLGRIQGSLLSQVQFPGCPVIVQFEALSVSLGQGVKIWKIVIRNNGASVDSGSHNVGS